MFVPGWPAVFFISGENQRLDDMIGETPGIQTSIGNLNAGWTNWSKSFRSLTRLRLGKKLPAVLPVVGRNC